MPIDVGDLQRLFDQVDLEGELGVARHVVEKDGQRQLGADVLDVAQQIVLPCREVIRSGQHDGARPFVAGVFGQVDRFGERRVGDADQNRHAAVDLAADALDQFHPHLVAQARALARGAEDEQAVHSAGQQCSTSRSRPSTSSSSCPASGVTMGGIMPRNGAGRGEFKGCLFRRSEGRQGGGRRGERSACGIRSRTPHSYYRAGLPLAGKRIKMVL